MSNEDVTKKELKERIGFLEDKLRSVYETLDHLHIYVEDAALRKKAAKAKKEIHHDIEPPKSGKINR